MARGRKNNSSGCSIWILLSVVICSILNFITDHPFLTTLIVLMAIFACVLIKTDLLDRISLLIKKHKEKYKLAGGTPVLLHDFVFAVMAVIETPRIWLQRTYKYHTFDEYYDLLSENTFKKETDPPILQDISNDKKSVSLPPAHIQISPDYSIPEEKDIANVSPIDKKGQVLLDRFYTSHESSFVAKSPDEPVNKKAIPVLSPFARYALNLGIKMDKIEGLSDDAIKPLVASRLKGGHKRKKNVLFAYAVYCRVKKIPLGNLYDEPCCKDCEKFAYNLSDTAQKYIDTCIDGSRLFRPYPGSSAYNESLDFLHLIGEEGKKHE